MSTDIRHVIGELIYRGGAFTQRLNTFVVQVSRFYVFKNEKTMIENETIICITVRTRRVGKIVYRSCLSSLSSKLERKRRMGLKRNFHEMGMASRKDLIVTKF